MDCKLALDTAEHTVLREKEWRVTTGKQYLSQKNWYARLGQIPF